ncbi:MAG: hypothetical protein JO032_02010 [Alphaproteobacteria bacterium]|nr:hypothetical protein [Alphaproteobacteria bacterium]
MRLATTAVVAAGLAAAVSGCTAVDAEDATNRAVAGGALGATLGAGLGATLAINPLLGAAYGAKTGAVLGAAVGAATAAPTPTYEPIAIPAEAVVPGFYDSWPPAYHRPPNNPETQSPAAG